MIQPTNPQLQELDPTTRDAYVDLLLFMGDSELVIGHRHSEWTGFAPSAEEDVAFSSIAQDEMGHAHLYYALVTGADDEDAVDRLVLDRGPRAFRHLPVLHAPNGDWFFTIARHIYWDLFEDVFLRHALESDLPLLAGASRRILNEEQYHLEHADEWLALLSSAEKQRTRLAEQLARVVTMGGNPARSVVALAKLGQRKLEQRDIGSAFSQELLGRLRNADWTKDQVDLVAAPLAQGSPGASSPPGLFKLHKDLTGLRRAHAGASW